MTGKVLILGVSGRFGRHAAEAFWNSGWRVQLFDRTKDDLHEVAQGQDVIVNGWNPPYDRWATDLRDLTRRIIEAAQTSGATVIQPANIYVYGDGAPQVLKAETPHHAANTLGRLRIEMERAYRDAGVRTILLRAGDFLDIEPSGNWFDKIMLSRIRRGTFLYPGDPDVRHAWAFLPDLAAAAAGLANRRSEFGPFHEVLFPGYTLTGREMCARVEEALGQSLTLQRMSWLPVHLSRPVWPMARRLLEMRYLWSMPHEIDRTGFDIALPSFPETDASAAVESATRHQIRPDKSVARRRTGAIAA